MPDIHFDRFYRYEELTALLHAYAEEYPDFVRIASMDQSYEGRDLWVVSVTNRATGPARDKPALWIDGNIHSSEVSASTACLYHLHELVTGHGEDEEITRCLDTRAFYIAPRLSPDGAELALGDIPRLVRSSARPFPYYEEPLEGLSRADIDGDGRILSMRVPDPNGAWKVHPDEPRLMVRRDPTETGGDYYRLLPEGPVTDYDGVTLRINPPKQGMDMNRNFPYEWRAHAEQPGAGRYPASEPEVRAVVEFISDHPNIIGGVTFHTFSGVLLRPYTSRPDDAMPAEDLWVYKTAGAKGTELTGYPALAINHDFRYHPQQVISGGFDYIYEHLGMFMWAVEIWSPRREAGIENYHYLDWFRDHPVEDDLKLLRWNDEQLDGKGHVDWYPFDHPQLGPVELGGWNHLYAFTNPPPDRIEAEVARFPRWLLWQLLISPRLVLHSVTSALVGDDVYRVQLVVQNEGWLPTNVTAKALERKTVRGVICEIELPDGAELVTGKAREELGQLDGRSGRRAYYPWYGDATSDRVKVDWLVRAGEGGTVKLVARHERAGVVRVELAVQGGLVTDLPLN